MLGRDMFKKLFLFAICSFSFLFGLPLQERVLDPVALLELTSAFEISSNADLVAETQNRWLRKSGQERWELDELPLDQRQFVIGWAKNQGLFDRWNPIDRVYDVALILGATTSRMQMRLDFLKTLWDEGIRFQQIVWLTGDRPLDPRVDALMDRCENESEAAHILWEEAALPSEMRSGIVTFIAVPMKREGSVLKRPNTEDTIRAWLHIVPDPSCKKALFVSDQPFCGYQFAVVKSVLPEEISFDLVGPGTDQIDHPSAAAIILDSLARWIYQASPRVHI